MAPRRRPRKMVGNTRMDAALDAMRQLGFEETLIRQTVDELLDVYEGTQGWPFIEEASYKLLIETILAKQLSSVEDKDNARRDGVNETSSAATPTTGITEVESSGMLVQDPLSHASDDLYSASQTNDHHDSAPVGNVETDVNDTNVPTERGGHGGDIRVQAKKEQKPMDNVKGSNDKTFVSGVESTIVRSSMIESSKTHDKLKDNVKGSNDKTFVSNVESTIVRSSMIESSKTHDKLKDDVKGSDDEKFVSNVARSSMIDSSKTHDKLKDNVKGSNYKTFVSNVARNSMIESSKKRGQLPCSRRRPYHGWISHDSEVDLIYFPLPPLPERIEKWFEKSEASQRRRCESRWDEKPDDM